MNYEDLNILFKNIISFYKILLHYDFFLNNINTDQSLSFLSINHQWQSYPLTRNWHLRDYSAKNKYLRSIQVSQ